MSQDFQQTAVQDFEQSQCQNRILSGDVPAGVYYRHIEFFMTQPLADVQSYIDTLNANADEIMLSMYENDLAGSYTYDFDIFPTFDISNGVYGAGGGYPLTLDGSHIESEPYENPAPTEAESIAAADGARKLLSLIWVLQRATPVGTAKTLNNFFNERSFATGGALPDTITTPTASVTSDVPLGGSLFKIPVANLTVYTFAAPVGGFSTIFGQLNTIPTVFPL